MRTDDTARLAKMMNTPEDALRAARLPQEKVNSIFRRARVAKWQSLISGSLILPLFLGSGLLAEYHGGQFLRLAGFMSLASFVSVCIWGFTKSASNITAEATTAMQRRLVELDKITGRAQPVTQASSLREAGLVIAGISPKEAYHA